MVWEHFKQAYNWDQSNFSLPVHERLTEQHFELDLAAKMRNHLAEDVLGRKMLFLMEVCNTHKLECKNWKFIEMITNSLKDKNESHYEMLTGTTIKMRGAIF